MEKLKLEESRTTLNALNLRQYWYLQDLRFPVQTRFSGLSGISYIMLEWYLLDVSPYQLETVQSTNFRWNFNVDNPVNLNYRTFWFWCAAVLFNITILSSSYRYPILCYRNVSVRVLLRFSRYGLWCVL